MVKFMDCFKSRTEQETDRTAQDFAKRLKKGDIVCLYGDLGAGKTAFVRGICKQFGLQDLVSSPTFAIVNEYLGKVMDVFHFDAYRIGSLDEALGCGLDEYFKRDGIILIEWPDPLLPLIEQDYYRVSIRRDLESSDTARNITIERVAV